MSDILLVILILLLALIVSITCVERYYNLPGEVDISVPMGQIASEKPLSKKCLLSRYQEQCKNLPKKHVIRGHKGSIYDYKPYDHIKISRCKDLNYTECLTTPRCGWLKNQCVAGTPIGPLNPLHVPYAENNPRRNMIDTWKYIH